MGYLYKLDRLFVVATISETGKPLPLDIRDDRIWETVEDAEGTMKSKTDFYVRQAAPRNMKVMTLEAYLKETQICAMSEFENLKV